MALIMFFSVKSLGLPLGAATVAGLIPLLLGIVDVMAPTAFGITALIFILAVSVHIFPEQHDSLKKMVTEGLAEVHATAASRPAAPVSTMTQAATATK